MAALPKISETQRQSQLKEGQKNNVFVRASEYNKLIDRINSITIEDGVIDISGDIEVDDLTVGDDATITGDLVAGTITTAGASALNGAVTQSLTTDSTSKDTGAIVTEGGIGVEKAIFAGTTINAGTRLTTGAGTVSTPGLVVGANDNGAYEVSATQLGFSISNALVGGFNTTGAFTDVISEQTSTVGVTIDGALIKDGSFTGKQATATATADGLTTGLLSGADQFVTVTSSSANNIICLPSDATCPIGTVIRGWVGANGFELRSLAADTTQTINNVTAGVTNEAAIPATTNFSVEKVASLTWLLTAVDELGAVITAIIPDAV